MKKCARGKKRTHLPTWARNRGSRRTWDARTAVTRNSVRSLEGTKCLTRTAEISSLGGGIPAHRIQAAGRIPGGLRAIPGERC